MAAGMIEQLVLGASSVRPFVEDNVQRDQQKSSFLKSSLERTEQLAKRMTEILNTFGDRVEHLEGALRPIHKQTEELTRARVNIEEVQADLSAAISYFQTSSAVSPTIAEGPQGQTEKYVQSLDRVRLAMKYFETNMPGNSELVALTRLWNNGLRALEVAFQKMIAEHNYSVPTNEMLEMSDAQLEEYVLFDEATVGTLGHIAAWLTRSNCTLEICRAYSKSRSQCAAETMIDIVMRGGTSSQGSSLKTPRGTLVPSHATHSSSKPARSLFKKMFKFHKSTPSSSSSSSSSTSTPRKQSADLSARKVGGGGGGGDTPTRSVLDAVIEDQLAAISPDADNSYFVHYTRALLGCLIIEHRVAADIMPSSLLEGVLTLVYNPLVDAYVGYADMLLGSLSKRVGSKPSCALVVFQMLDLIRNKDEQFKMALRWSNNADMASRFDDCVKSYALLCRGVLDEVADPSAEFHGGKRVPADGTVHEATTSVLSLLSSFYSCPAVLGTLLSDDFKTNTVLHSSSNVKGIEVFGWLPFEASSKHVISWLMKVLEGLVDDLLLNKAKQYEDPALAAIFVVNNIDYINRYVGSAPFSEILRKRKQQLESKWGKLIEEYTTTYQEMSFNKIKGYLSMATLPDDPHNLAKKDKELVKEKYSGFNDELDALVLTQTKYAVPNEEVRESIRRSNIALIVPMYKRFDQAFRHSGFSVKNPQKYLKNTPDDVKAKLSSFFDVAS